MQLMLQEVDLLQQHCVLLFKTIFLGSQLYILSLCHFNHDFWSLVVLFSHLMKHVSSHLFKVKEVKFRGGVWFRFNSLKL